MFLLFFSNHFRIKLFKKNIAYLYRHTIRHISARSLYFLVFYATSVLKVGKAEEKPIKRNKSSLSSSETIIRFAFPSYIFFAYIQAYIIKCIVGTHRLTRRDEVRKKISALLIYLKLKEG